MFLKHLTDPQKDAFLYLAHATIEADGVVADEEAELLGSFKLEMNLDSGHEPLEFEIHEATKFFTQRFERVAVMLELIALANVEGEYSSQERALLEQICELFTLSETDMQAMQAWVAKQEELLKAAATLMKRAA